MPLFEPPLESDRVLHQGEQLPRQYGSKREISADGRFVISDHPVVAYSDFVEHVRSLRDLPGAIGLVAKGLQYFMPVSPNVTLPLYDPSTYAYGNGELRVTARDQATSAWYVAYLQEHVFKPVRATDVDCKPVGDAPAMFYPSTLSGHGNDGGDRTTRCACGGWNLSVGAVYKLLVSLAVDERLLTATQKADMTSRCLGWDCSNTTQRGYVGKRGDWHDPRDC